MAFMVTLKNRYVYDNKVSGNMCIRDAYYFDDSCSNNFDIRDGTSEPNVVGTSLLWNYLSFAGIHNMVTFLICSFFKMGKLTQSQKALFLWRSPLAKLN